MPDALLIARLNSSIALMVVKQYAQTIAISVLSSD